MNDNFERLSLITFGVCSAVIFAILGIACIATKESIGWILVGFAIAIGAAVTMFGTIVKPKNAVPEDSEIEQQTQKQKEAINRDLAFNIIAVFEDILDFYNIDIPSTERIDAVNAGEPNVAHIYGHPYYYLEDKIVEMLEQYNNVKGGLTSEHFDTVQRKC